MAESRRNRFKGWYVVTGVLTNGRRFKAIRTKNYVHAFGINLYKGSVWYEDEHDKRKLLLRVWP